MDPFAEDDDNYSMLMRRLIALYNLKKTQPQIEEDQKLALLHAPFTGTTLFGGELAKLQEANTKHANAVTVFPPTAPPVSYSTRPYVGRGRSYIQMGEGAILERVVAGAEDRVGQRPTATITKPKEGQTCMCPTGIN